MRGTYAGMSVFRKQVEVCRPTWKYDDSREVGEAEKGGDENETSCVTLYISEV